MNKISTLKGIAQNIATVIEVQKGGTGYLDDSSIFPEASISKGIDAVGRAFITLCVRCTSSNPQKIPSSGGIATVFQRYSNEDAPDVVVQAQNVGMPRLFQGAAQEEDLTMLEELVRTGRSVAITRLWGEEPVVTTIEVISVEEAMTYKRSRKVA